MVTFETIEVKLPAEMYNELTAIFARYGQTLEEAVVLFSKRRSGLDAFHLTIPKRT